MNLNSLLFNSTNLISGPNPIISTLLFVALAVVPVAALGMTSFLKLNVVFSILRNAIGAGQLPSAALVGLLSIVLTMQIMAPVASEIKQAMMNESSALNVNQSNAANQGSLIAGGGKKEQLKVKSKTANVKEPEGVEDLINALRRGSVPLEAFLRKHGHERERAFFASLSSQKVNGERVTDKEGSLSGIKAAEESLWSLIPAFVISELQEAFSVGLMILLPFLVIDLIITNLLVALGMTMVTPVTVALPFKLLLFVLCDGWFVICRGLVLSYQ